MPASPTPSRSPSPPRAHISPVPEESLRNIDLGGGSQPMVQPSAPPATASSTTKDLEAGRRPAPAGAGEEDLETAPAAAAAAAAAGGGRASSRLALVLAQCRRFDVELCAVFLAGLLVTTACSIFTKDEGWFRLEAPLRELVGSPSGATVVYTIGLSTYTAQAHSVDDPTLILYTHQGDLDEASGKAEQIAYALYAFLVLSLVSAAGMLWYIALFFGYLKGPEINRGREAAVRCLGLQAMGLGVALLALGTAAFRNAVAEAFVRRPFPNQDGSPFNDVDTAGRRLETEYAYHLTGLTWFLWLLVGGLLLFRSCCWAKRAARRGELEAEAAGAHV